MRLMVMGQQSFGQACLKAILEKGTDEIVGVFCAPDPAINKVDPIKECALENGLKLFQPDNFKDSQIVETIKELEPDLCVMAYVTIFVPETVRNIPKFGSICFHPSLLPEFRGPSSINWPIISGATKTGLTIFWPNDGLDEGEILLQKEVTIEPDDTLGDVYFKKIFPLGIEALLESVELISEGRAPKIVQDHSIATYQSWCREEDVKIDWSRTTADIYNLIRGSNPQPGAWTTFNGIKLKIFDCSILDQQIGKSGEVVQFCSEGFIVSTSDGGILIRRVKPENDKKIPAVEVVDKLNLKLGARLG